MNTFDKLQWMITNCVSVHIDCNQHRCYYDPEPENPLSLQVYPNTPNGFELIEGTNLTVMIDEMFEAVLADIQSWDDNKLTCPTFRKRGEAWKVLRADNEKAK